MSGRSDASLAERLHFDNRLRLAISLNTLAIAWLLYDLGFLSKFKPLLYILAFYSIPYGTVGLWNAFRSTPFRAARYVLSLIDFLAITATVNLTGGPHSPLFYLYPVPFLVHALYFDLPMILWDGVWCLLSYSGALLFFFHAHPTVSIDLGIGQLAFLTVLIAVSLFTAREFQRKDASAKKNLTAQDRMVAFLEALNALPPALLEEELHERILALTRQALEPFQVYSRLWLANAPWQTLRGLGEHPALRPGSMHHLPMTACPAFALRRPFQYSQHEGEPCASEQFNYAKHRCLPIMRESLSFGVLFLGTFAAGAWREEELHFFDMVAEAIAMTLERRTLFQKLEEKITDLNFSFEVGAASLATFGGSTQSIEDTTAHILDSVLSILKVDRASLMLWDPQTQKLQTQWVRGGQFKVQSPLRLAMGEGMAGWALETGEPYWAEYAMGDPHYQPSTEHIRSLLCVPVYTQDHQPIGVINAVTLQRARPFLPREINFLKSFGRQAALAIENARLHHKNRTNISQLHELSQLKTQFLSLVSHDLRGPLTGIRGFCEVLKVRLGPKNPGLELVDQIQRQVDLQERMVDDLLDLARMEKSQLSIEPTPTDLATLLNEEVAKSQIEAKERRVALSLNIMLPGNLGLVLVDGGRIRQTVWNLIHNALKFTPEEGRVAVRARVENEAVLIEVEDTGIGLAAEVQERIFDKFFQVSPGGSTSSRGLGLGLAICKEIILAHHGKIRAYSRGLGLGTTMSFSLPLSAIRIQNPPKSLAA